MRPLFLFPLLVSLVILCADARCSPASPGGVPPFLPAAVVHIRADSGPSPIGFVGRSTATGFFVGPRLVLTCNHVSRVPGFWSSGEARRYRVDLGGGATAPAELVMRDVENDLALLRLDDCSDEAWPHLTVGRFNLSAGDEVVVAGNFPRDVRLVRGPLLSASVHESLALAGAKVRVGFSGAPILGPDGSVQGILSQRDAADNAVFVRSDAIRALLRRYEQETGSRVAGLAPENGDARAPGRKAVRRSRGR